MNDERVAETILSPPPSSLGDGGPKSGPPLTVEMALYGALLILALVVRLTALGSAPLTEAEANTALAAWRSVRGDAWRPEAYVPLLYSVQLLTFFFGWGNEFAARLLPALAGTALVALPAALRDVLGRRGALLAAGLLALSPTWVYFSRTADWPILAALAAGGVLISVVRYARLRAQRVAGRQRSAGLGAVALGLGLATGPGAYTMLLGILAVWFVALRPREARSPRAGTMAGPLGGRHLAVAAFAFLLIASAFMANPDGLGVSVDAAGRWVASLRPWGRSIPRLYLPATLLLYEHLTLALALVGAVAGLRQREPLSIGLLAWVGLSLAMSVLLAQGEPSWLPGVLLPLVLLAGVGAERIYRWVRRDASLFDGIALYLLLVVLGLGLAALAAYVWHGSAYWQGYALLGAGALVVGWLAYWLWAQDRALRVGALAVLILLGGFSARATTAVAYQAARDSREPLMSASTWQVRDLEHWLARLSSMQARDPRALAVAYDPSLGPLIDWTLRDYPNAQPIWRPHAAPGVWSAMITPALSPDERPAGYVGQRFRLMETWSWGATSHSARDRLRWFLYREPVGQAMGEEVILWVPVTTWDAAP